MGSVRTQLQTAFKKRLEQTAKRLAEGMPVDAVRDEVEWLDRASKVLALTPPKWTADALPAALVALICLGTASALWGTRLSRTNISLTAESDSLRADVAKDWTLEPRIKGEFVHLERLTSLQAPNLGLTVDSPTGDGWVRVEGGRITVQSLHILPRARFEITTTDDAMTLFIARAAFQGRMIVVGKGTLTAGTSTGKGSVNQSYNVPVPETIDFSVATAQTTPSSLSIHSRESWQLGSSPFANIGFSVEASSQRGTLVVASGLSSGQLRFNDTKWEPVIIRENEALSLRQMESARTDVAIHQNVIRTTVNGVVGDVTLGEREVARRIAPSYLDYFYSQQSVTFFWGCALFLWGTLWGIRNTLFR